MPTRFSAFEVCALPTAARVDGAYLSLARSITEQGEDDYSKVIMFATPEAAAAGAFSMTIAAQAFALQLAADVLLVDGDLRRGRLSQSVWPSGGGLIEAMLGTAAWPDVIHPTTTPRISFVPRGIGPIPTLERAQFGWAALRPRFRAVLIGLCDAAQPETLWLAAHCDCVYLVVSRAHTRRHTAKRAHEILMGAGATVAGCVVIDD